MDEASWENEIFVTINYVDPLPKCVTASYAMTLHEEIEHRLN